MPVQEPGDDFGKAGSPAILTDRGICRECVRELADLGSRYYHFPLIHCNRCGPRSSILEDLPLKRSNTSLRDFPPCAECQSEREDPSSRRYRLETIICSQCGPQVRLEKASKGAAPKTEAQGDQAIHKAQRILAQGKLLGISGSRGSSLFCDAGNPQAVERLRQRLDSPDRPLTLIAANLQSAAEICYLDETAVAALESAARPVVILEKRAETHLTKQAAPFLKTLGIRLPATGLEQLLFMEGKRLRLPVGRSVRPPSALLAASGDLISKIISVDRREAIARLLEYVEGCLLHDLEGELQAGETVVRVFPGSNYAIDRASVRPGEAVFPVRIGRGWTPLPVELPFTLPPVLAGGSERQNTTCHTQASQALLSGQNGDLKQAGNLAIFEQSAMLIERLSGIRPEILAHDLDRQALATRFILERSRREALPAVAVQHHHAHIAACMVENGLPEGQPVAGIAFDLGGLGEDAEQTKPVLWGGEFLVAGYTGYMRPYHMAYLPLPGGEAATNNLARTALAYLWEADIAWEIDLPSVSAICAQENSLLRSMLKHRLNTPLHSSMGRLFEAIASLAGLRQEVSYPSQALLEMESATDRDEKAAYTFEIRVAGDGSYEIDPLPVILAVVEDVRNRVRIGRISARLQNGVAELVYQVCTELRSSHNINRIALSGEVWQNTLLLQKTTSLLQEGSFQVYTHHLAPPNDACLSLGQAVIAGMRLTAA